MRVLIADDDPVSTELLVESLAAFGYEVTVATHGGEAFQLIRSGRFRMVVSDWEMPVMNGLELCREIRRRPSSGYIYVILLTSHEGSASVVQGLEAGADDFLTKPFEPGELHLRLRAGQRLLSLESRDLTIFALAKLAESRDPETGAHLDRIRAYCRLLGSELAQWDKYRAQIDGEYCQLLYQTSPLHDVGKVGIPDRVLLKPGRLDADEFEIMKTHTLLGAATLEAARVAHPDAQFLSMAYDIALNHHERYDGRGYPNGLAGDRIPFSGRITALADVYDALTSKRIYKEAFTHETAKAIILEGRGTQFDPDVVTAFERREEDFVAIRERFSNEQSAVLSLADVPEPQCASPASV